MTDATKIAEWEAKAEKCPECGMMALHIHGMSGEDDHGRIEGEIEACDNCGYTNTWAGRC